MSLLTHQRIIANGLAQLRSRRSGRPVERSSGPTRRTLQGARRARSSASCASSSAQLVVEQERKVVVFSQWRRMLRLAHWAVRDVLARRRAPRGVLHRRTRASSGARRTSSTSTTTRRAASCSPPTRAAWGSTCSAPRAPASTSSCRGTRRCSSSASAASTASARSRPIDVYNLVSEAGIEARIAGLVGDKQALLRRASSTATSDEVRVRAVGVASSPGSSGSWSRRGRRSRRAEARPKSRAQPTERSTRSWRRPTRPARHRPWRRPRALGPRRPRAQWRVRPHSRCARPAGTARDPPPRDGGLAIEAPPEAADGLAALFEGMGSCCARPGLDARHEMTKLGRNEPCPCGSGKKYKRCCPGERRHRPATRKRIAFTRPSDKLDDFLGEELGAEDDVAWERYHERWIDDERLDDYSSRSLSENERGRLRHVVRLRLPVVRAGGGPWMSCSARRPRGLLAVSGPSSSACGTAPLRLWEVADVSPGAFAHSARHRVGSERDGARAERVEGPSRVGRSSRRGSSTPGPPVSPRSSADSSSSRRDCAMALFKLAALGNLRRDTAPRAALRWTHSSRPNAWARRSPMPG